MVNLISLSNLKNRKWERLKSMFKIDDSFYLSHTLIFSQVTCPT